MGNLYLCSILYAEPFSGYALVLMVLAFFISSAVYQHVDPYRTWRSGRMNKAVLTSALLGLMMVGTAGTAKLMVPTHYLADTRPKTNLDTMLPLSFGDWKEEKATVSSVVNPSVERALKEIYTQTLSRTYVNKQGYRVMSVSLVILLGCKTVLSISSGLTLGYVLIAAILVLCEAPLTLEDGT